VTASLVAEPIGDDDRLFCYRHPDRETWIRCGRCDRPICTSCAMQGPVGSRCKQCGKLAFDPLTSFTAQQLLLGVATAVGAGIVAGFIAARIGFFSIFISYFAGMFIADIVQRVTGYKRGPVMLAIVLGGIVIGTLAGSIGGFLVEYQVMLSTLDATDDAGLIGPLLLDAATWALVAAAAACVGAWSRLR
jgi:MFS family permease